MRLAQQVDAAYGFQNVLLAVLVPIPFFRAKVEQAPGSSIETEARFQLTPETLARTTIGDLKYRAPVNLERALRVGDRMGGHMVQGHVDAVGVVRQVSAEGAGRRMRFALPGHLVPFVSEKGSIAVDGISLTIAACELDTFEVAFIPHTLEHTIARGYRLGTRVNVEVDLVARYLARLLQKDSA